MGKKVRAQKLRDPARAPALDRGLQTPARDRSWWPAAAVTAVYGTIVIVAAVHHEPWRDEVVPLSIAREMPSFVDLWRMVRHEGHPLFWYVILRYTYLLFGTTSVLPAASVAIAIAAIFVFAWKAPLPLWLKCLFVFGYLPVFEYSVVARANGLAMLMLFAFCAFSAGPTRYPIAAALALVGLANSAALGFVTAAAAGVAIAIDWAIARGRTEVPSPRALVAAGIYLAGLSHALISNTPDPSVLSLKLYDHDVGRILSALGNAILDPIGHSTAILWVPLASVWVWLTFLLLWRRPAVLAFLFLSLIGFELMFTLVYPASPRHKGYVLLALIAALWLWNPWSRRDATPLAGPLAIGEFWLRRLLLIPLAATLCYQIVIGAGYVVDDIQLDYSSSRRLATILASDPRLENAIVIGEPENLTESLPYYRDNPVYLPQERAFRNWLLVWIPGGRRGDYNLAELLATATDLRDRHGVSVVMALGWRLDGPDAQRGYAGTFFEQNFAMSAASREAFLSRTELLGRLREASFTDENYDVFVLW